MLNADQLVRGMPDRGRGVFRRRGYFRQGRRRLDRRHTDDHDDDVSADAIAPANSHSSPNPQNNFQYQNEHEKRSDKP
ncbi:hypothetical protein MTP99_008072 [Tenebrio molitor]|nr:hypothetical protein MTP99_008072 [Tenebrio molitor]